MKQRLIKFIVTAVILIVAVFVIVNINMKNREVPESLFYTYDSKDRVIKGHYSESENIWYLFITSDMEYENVDIYSAEELEGAEFGSVNNFLNRIENSFTEERSATKVKTPSGVYNVEVMKSELPSLYIDLANVSLEDIHKDKNISYKGNSFYITDPEGKESVSLPGIMEIKGRGNSTWNFYDKKGYQIKFSSSVSLLGMEEAKTWILLANSNDDSLMRAKLSFDLAEEMGFSFVPDMEYVDLWIDGEYRGNYLLSEKVEIDSNRLDLANAYGAIFEHDEGFYLEKENWFLNEMLQRHFTVNDSVKNDENVINEAIKDFNNTLDSFLSYLYTTPASKVSTEKLSEMIDLESFIKYYLINEYVSNRESFVSSFYWYKDGENDVIHLGPIWDFDTSMGNDYTEADENYGKDHIMFKYLLSGEEFYSKTVDIYNEYKENFKKLSENAYIIKQEIESSADMNYKRWEILGTENPKGSTDYSVSFGEAVESVVSWLDGRYEAFNIENTDSVSSVVSDDCYKMDVTFESKSGVEKVKIAVWSLENDNDDLNWYDAYETSNGIWQCTVDLTMHNSSGIYRIAVYGDNPDSALTAGYSFVETARKPLCEMKTEIDGSSLSISLSDSGLYEEMLFAVWGDDDSQDDLVWYEPEKDGSGIWLETVDVGKHPGTCVYIHAYGVENGIKKLAFTETVFIPET